MIPRRTLGLFIGFGLALFACEEAGLNLPESDAGSLSTDETGWMGEYGKEQSEKSQASARPAQAAPLIPPALPYSGPPRVSVDEGHHNYHTLTGTYAAFGETLSSDGFEVSAFSEVFSSQSLVDVDILVISNAQNEKNVEAWSVPVYSAFSADEIRAVEKWVREGGALFLIADHMPMAGAAYELARAFGIEMTDGFVIFGNQRGCGGLTFTLENQLLTAGVLTRGRNENERVDHVMSFCGQGFFLPEGAYPVLLLDPSSSIVLPDESWVWDASTPTVSADGTVQGGILDWGQGRLAVFGEAQIFTCKSPNSGMCNPNASQNRQFLLNVMHWLDEEI